MKGSIAAFTTALERFLSAHPDHEGSIALMMTSDEEGIATHGVVKVVEVLEARNEKIDLCLVGEPSSDKKIGDVIRVGRRGSLCAKLTVTGIQGGGTDTHLMLVDLTPKGLTGKLAEQTLDQAGITVNKNSIPFDQQSPNITSGIRIGTPAVSTRGMHPAHMNTVAGFIHRALQAVGDEAALKALKSEVAEFCTQFPLHQGVLGLA